jgi:hypothetical protein
MQPGLSRAIPLAILGFLFGGAIVVVLRVLQSLEPVWDVGAGIVVAGVFTAIFFVWGMGGFDPRMSAHAEEPGVEPHEGEPAPEPDSTPRALLGSGVWTVTTLVIVLFLAVWGFALIPGGFALTTTNDPMASPTTLGTFTLTLFEREFIVSELVAFLIYGIIMIGSVAVIGGGIAWFFITLSRGIAESKAIASGAIAVNAPQLSAPVESVPAAPNPLTLPPVLRMWVTLLVTFSIVSVLFYLVLLPISINHAPEYITPFSVLFGVLAAIFVAKPPFLPHLVHVWAAILFWFGILYFIFYEVAIGLVIAQPYELRVLISLVNAFLIAVLLVRASWVVWFIGASARVTLTILRALPRILFQR